MWVLLLEPEMKQWWVLHQRPHSPLAARPLTAARSFMSEPETGIAATARPEKLHHRASMLIYPLLAAE